jgi:hypothetical protein
MGMTRKQKLADVRVPSYLQYLRYRRPGRINPLDTPPVVQNHIPGIQIHSPENFRKSEKVASSFCGEKENYLTNEGIGAIVHKDSNILAVTAP